MKIVKMGRFNDGYCYIVDEIPEVTYEKIGLDRVGFYKDETGKVVISHHLKYQPTYGGNTAFAGRQIHLRMNDGTDATVQHNWFDNGYYKEHGFFAHVAMQTLDNLKKCDVYMGVNINVEVLDEMIRFYDYTDRVYSREELREFVKSERKGVLGG